MAPDVINGVDRIATDMAAGTDPTLAIVTLSEPSVWLSGVAGIALVWALHQRREDQQFELHFWQPPINDDSVE